MKWDYKNKGVTSATCIIPDKCVVKIIILKLLNKSKKKKWN